MNPRDHCNAAFYVRIRANAGPNDAHPRSPDRHSTPEDMHTHRGMHSHLCLCTERPGLIPGHTHASPLHNQLHMLTHTHLPDTHAYPWTHMLMCHTLLGIPRCTCKHRCCHIQTQSHTHTHVHVDISGHTFIPMHIPAPTCQHLHGQTLMHTQTGHFWVQTGGDGECKQLQQQRLDLWDSQPHKPPPCSQP